MSRYAHAIQLVLLVSNRSIQLYQSPEMKEKVKSLGMELLDYDACSTIWVKDWESWEKFSSSPEYAAGSCSLLTWPPLRFTSLTDCSIVA
jgi:hypothetical protein